MAVLHRFCCIWTIFKCAKRIKNKELISDDRKTAVNSSFSAVTYIKRSDDYDDDDDDDDDDGENDDDNEYFMHNSNYPTIY